MSVRRSILPVVLLSLAPVVSLASPAFAGEGAVIVRGFACAIPVEGAGLEEGAVFTTRSKSVTTPSDRAVLVCHGQLPDGMRRDRTMKYATGPCGISEGHSSPTSHRVVNRSGRLLLTCHDVGRR